MSRADENPQMITLLLIFFCANSYEMQGRNLTPREVFILF
jgi:hypothetical protein